MLCEEVMKRGVECISASESVQGAAGRMASANIGFLPVCDGENKVLGTLTDRDLALRVLAEGKPGTTTVGEVMTREVVACSPTDDLRKAERLMGENHKSRILCCDDDGRLVGVISLSDIAQWEEGSRAAKTLKQVTEREAHP
jgi:CBS domain-containing protein